MNIKLKLFITGCLLVACSVAKSQSTEIPAARLKAAGELLDATGIEAQLPAMYENMFDAFSSQMPAENKAKFKDIIIPYLKKYMSYAAMRPEIAKVYAEEFTDDELKQITQFYLTPAGKKINKNLATLQQKGMAIGQQLVQAHLPELQEELKKAFPGPPPMAH